MRKMINKIKSFVSNYKRYLIGQQTEIEDTPFSIRAGVLHDDGVVINMPACSHTEHVDAFVLTAATDGVKVLSYENNAYRKLIIIIKATAATISWDYRIEIALPKYGLINGILATGDGSTLYQKTAVASSGVWSFLLTEARGAGVPYGNDLVIYLIMDNNHATTPITVNATMIFFDPVV